MTTDEARQVMKNPDAYSMTTVMYAIRILQNAGEWPFDD